jgi:murein DD-endopeptidase MepM/ murein hydrolase activator NlpD
MSIFIGRWWVLYGMLFFAGISILHSNLLMAQQDSTYKVLRGNTLYSISQKVGVTTGDLREWNDLPDNTIYPGQVLRIKPRVSAANDTAHDPPKDEKDQKISAAQPIQRKLTQAMIPYGLQIAALEQHYDRHLNMVLSQYLKPGTFLVDVRVEMEPASETGVKSPRQSRPESEFVLPGLPYMPEGFFNRDYAGQAGAMGFGNLYSALQLKRLNIIIYTDTSYSRPDLIFVKNLVKTAAKVESQRNDVVQVISQSFLTEAMIKAKEEKPNAIRIEVPEQKNSLAFPVLIISVTVIVILITLLLLVLFRKEERR